MADSQKHFATYPSLVDKVVIISGGATGIGGSLSRSFALQGSQVVILDILDDAALELVRELDSANALHSPTYHHCDVTDIDGAIKPIAAAILAQHPKIDAVINNAALDKRMSTLEITPEAWDQGMNVNLRHQFFLTQSLMPGLVAAGSSSVINMSSISWSLPAVGLVPYVASKSAIIGLTKTLAKEFGPKGVRVNSIMPGAIATERQKREVLTGNHQAHVLEQQSLKRVLQPDDVSRLALWLAADDSCAVTNQSIVVDGGWL